MKKIFYNETNYNYEEIKAVTNVLKNQSHTLVGGKCTNEFEKKICSLFGKKYGVFVNSGSSANLLALASLDLPKGSEVITPCLTFATTVSPIIQLGLIPSFIDIDIRTLNINVDKIESAINKNTSAIMIPNLIGNLPDWNKIHGIAKKNSIPIIEDSADTVGYKIRNKNTGNLSNLVTTSFYASHIITCAGIGGMVCTDDIKLYNSIKMLRGWGRSSELYKADSEISINENLKNRFDTKIGEITYDRKFIFQHNGYNFFAPEICAAFGLKQLKKFRNLYKKRVSNFKHLQKYISNNLTEYLIEPLQHSFVDTIWLAFPLILREKMKNKTRTKLQIFLEKRNIQTRPIFSGNITKQPMIKNQNFKSNEINYDNADYIMKNGMLIGCHPKLTKKNLEFICRSLSIFFTNE